MLADELNLPFTVIKASYVQENLAGDPRNGDDLRFCVAFCVPVVKGPMNVVFAQVSGSAQVSTSPYVWNRYIDGERPRVFYFTFVPYYAINTGWEVLKTFALYFITMLSEILCRVSYSEVPVNLTHRDDRLAAAAIRK